MSWFGTMTTSQNIDFLLTFVKIIFVSSFIIIITKLISSNSQSEILTYAEYITLIIASISLILIIIINLYSQAVDTPQKSRYWMIVASLCLMLVSISWSIYLFKKYKNRIVFERTSEQYYTYSNLSDWIILGQTILILYWLYDKSNKSIPHASTNNVLLAVMLILASLNVYIVSVVDPILENQSTGG